MSVETRLSSKMIESLRRLRGGLIKRLQEIEVEHKSLIQEREFINSQLREFQDGDGI